MSRIIVCLLCMLSLDATGQTPFGAIVGTVKDPTGGVVNGARITIRNTATGATRHALSESGGNYVVTALPAGDYEIVCEATGFKHVGLTGIVLAIDERARVDISLELGELRQNVEIRATSSLVETDTASQGTVVPNERILQLPLNGRNFQQLATLGPGTVAGPAGAPSSFSVAGTRGVSNSFMLDGVSNTNVNGNITY